VAATFSAKSAVKKFELRAIAVNRVDPCLEWNRFDSECLRLLHVDFCAFCFSRTCLLYLYRTCVAGWLYYQTAAFFVRSTWICRLISYTFCHVVSFRLSATCFDNCASTHKNVSDLRDWTERINGAITIWLCLTNSLVLKCVTAKLEMEPGLNVWRDPTRGLWPDDSTRSGRRRFWKSLTLPGVPNYVYSPHIQRQRVSPTKYFRHIKL